MQNRMRPVVGNGRDKHVCRTARRFLAYAISVVSLMLGPACRSASKKPPPTLSQPPRREPAAPPVQPVAGRVVVKAWAEPPRLPSFGGQTQIQVSVRRPAGDPMPGVEVRLSASTGSLYSGGRVLTTDEAGKTRDRLTAYRSATVTINAGGTVLALHVPVINSN